MDAILASIRSMMADGVSVGTAAAPVAAASAEPEPPASNVSKLFSETPPPAAGRPVVASMPSVRPSTTPEPETDNAHDPAGSDPAVERAMALAMEEARVEIERGDVPAPQAPVMRDEEPVRPAPRDESGRDARPDAPPPAVEERRPVAAEPARGGAASQPLEPLLSREADSAVSGAFRDLAASALTGSGRTIDDVVEDLLRPMLTDWLDDNLPSLVERLVREEIERVARGRR